MLVERFSKVMHIVSTVEGDLREGAHPLDALAVTFPAGTVTGAPKRRAMELIAEHEPTARGAYAGAVGYLTFAGDLDFCITIRTAQIVGGVATSRPGRASCSTRIRRPSCARPRRRRRRCCPRSPRRESEPMILVVDHYDSFTYNLVQLVESLGHPTTVVRSDERPAGELVAMGPDAVVLRPAPDTRATPAASPSSSTCSRDDTPLFGVCLGHQAIGLEAGGTVDRATPVHGKASLVFHEGAGILEGVAVPFEAGRYHSLVVERDDLPGRARAHRVDRGRPRDGDAAPGAPAVRRAVPPREHPHPRGPTIVRNFLALTA